MEQVPQGARYKIRTKTRFSRIKLFTIRTRRPRTRLTGTSSITSREMRRTPCLLTNIMSLLRRGRSPSTIRIIKFMYPRIKTRWWPPMPDEAALAFRPDAHRKFNPRGRPAVRVPGSLRCSQSVPDSLGPEALRLHLRRNCSDIISRPRRKKTLRSTTRHKRSCLKKNRVTIKNSSSLRTYRMCSTSSDRATRQTALIR